MDHTNSKNHCKFDHFNPLNNTTFPAIFLGNMMLIHKSKTQNLRPVQQLIYYCNLSSTKHTVLQQKLKSILYLSMNQLHQILTRIFCQETNLRVDPLFQYCKFQSIVHFGCIEKYFEKLKSFGKIVFLHFKNVFVSL